MIQVVVAILLVGFILIQHGKGADAGAAFGSGASSTMFGSRGSSKFLVKFTTFLVVIFLGNSLFLAYLAAQNVRQPPPSVMDQTLVPVEETMTVINETDSQEETDSQDETDSQEDEAVLDTVPSDLPTIPE